ncbi:uncharacterized protein LOC130949486 [Arachis stenosperma]|uniref:uncharacterized protein LOC130949486 n=1 Tax=Arachis stenosperma TaxID=217475 RepID=UPI0025ABBB2D|nr:uncharacterized protein LOC130949486 [Arachis stenosperma]
MAKLWDFYVGIKLASELGIAKLVVESDSRCIVTLVQKAFPENHGSSSLIRSIKELLAKMDNVEVRHIYREANFYADALAKLGQGEVSGIKFFEQPPLCLFHHLFVDASGIKFKRLVIV